MLLMSFFTSCSSFNESDSPETAEVVFDDGYKAAQKGEVNLDDIEFVAKDISREMPGGSSRDISETAADGSKINIAYDGFGNKTETRCFNDLRVKCLQLKTPANGQREVFVFGHNGQTKKLPENMLDRVLTASANEIANAAAIYDFKKETRPQITSSEIPQQSKPLQPMPSYKFPVQNPLPKESEPVRDVAVPNDSPNENADSVPDQKQESLISVTKNRQPQI